MNDLKDNPQTLYRQYRELTTEDKDTDRTADAVERFKANRMDLQTQALQFNEIMASVGAETAKKRRSPWFGWRGLFGSQMMQLAVVCLCVIGLTGFLIHQRSYSWTSLVPGSVIEGGVVDSISRSFGGSAQLGFAPSSIEQSVLYSLGTLNTQLAVVMALEEESLLPYFATSLDRLSLTITSPSVADDVRALRTVVSERSADRIVGEAIATLQRSVEQSYQRSIDWFSLGRTIESLRLALVIADNQGDLSALKEMSVTVAIARVDRLQSHELPELNRVLGQIHDLSQRDLSLEVRRHLMQRIEQLNVVLR